MKERHRAIRRGDRTERRYFPSPRERGERGHETLAVALVPLSAWPPRHGTTRDSGSTSFQQARARKQCQPACKPGSVWRLPSATAIHLGRSLLGASCNQPGRRRGPRPTRRASPPRLATPIWSCSRWGLPCHPCRQGRGALLPHPFTLAAAGEPASAVCFLWHFPWGCPRRPLAATVDPWSPDFPPPVRSLAASGSDRPAG